MSVAAQPPTSGGAREAPHPVKATRETGRSNDASPLPAARPPGSAPEDLAVVADRAHIGLVGLDRLDRILRCRAAFGGPGRLGGSLLGLRLGVRLVLGH